MSYDTESGVPIAFSILVNNCENRVASSHYYQDLICDAIIRTRF